jgi:hypothetical protein
MDIRRQWMNMCELGQTKIGIPIILKVHIS